MSAIGQIGRAAGGSLVQQAMEAVSGFIRDHGLRVGDTLPGEAHFASTLGVSRAVMREAFGALAALRVIDVANGRKPRVGAMDGSVIAASLDHAVSTAQVSVSEVWDVRRTIELRTAELAATERTDEEASEIEALAARMAAEADDLERMPFGRRPGNPPARSGRRGDGDERPFRRLGRRPPQGRGAKAGLGTVRRPAAHRPRHVVQQTC